MTTEMLERGASTRNEDDAGEIQDADVTQYVVFMAGDEVFAVDMAPVQEIIRVPEVVRVPLAPATLDGLANLRGKVLPIISLQRLFGLPERERDDATRALVIDLGQPLGFVVDRVASVVGVEAGSIQDVGAIRSTVNTDLLSGLLKDVAGHPMVMVLDFAKLIASEFETIAKLSSNLAGNNAFAGEPKHDDEDDLLSDELHLVSFEVAEQEYAIAIEDVQEIVQVPEQIVHVPHSEAHVLGVMTLRNRLLPLVSLRRLFGLPPRSSDEQSRIVVVSLGASSVGVVMDRVNEVLRVPKAQIDAMPGLLARNGDLSDITEICRLGDGKRLVSIIAVENMFRHATVKEALNSVENLNEEALDNEPSDGEGVDDEEQVVVFRLGREEFGVPIESVQEIVRIPEQLTHVPKSPAFVEGVINLRGTVLPVIDQRCRFGLPPVERNDRQRIMIFLISDVRTGFIVDSVTEVLKIPRHLIENSPRLSGEQARLIGRVANLKNRMIQLIDASCMIEGVDLNELESFAE